MAKLMTDGAMTRCYQILAKEDLAIVSGDYRTAFIDLNSRTVHLPRWEDHSQDVADLLRAHEVSHALHTPVEGWHSSIKKKNDARFASYLNVIEDSRIERMIRSKFGGLKPIFIRAYRDIFDMGIFDSPIYGKMSDIDDFSAFNLIDRINIHEKIGAHVDVPFFNDTEKRLLLRTQTTRTWKEVAKVAEEVFQYDYKNRDKFDMQSLIDAMMKSGMERENEEFEKSEYGDDQDGLSDGFLVMEEYEEDEESSNEESSNEDTGDGGEEGEGDQEVDGSSSFGNDDGDDSYDDSYDDSDTAECEDENSESNEAEDPRSDVGNPSGEHHENQLPESLTDKAFRDNEEKLAPKQEKDRYGNHMRSVSKILRPQHSRVVNE